MCSHDCTVLKTKLLFINSNLQEARDYQLESVHLGRGMSSPQITPPCTYFTEKEKEFTDTRGKLQCLPVFL